MYPDERSLVKRMENRPFALLGINSDQSLEKLQSVLKEKNLTWRTWFDGPGTRGPIASKWNVSGWPTIYVVDHKGVIRAKGPRGKQMAEWVDKLVAIAESEVESQESASAQ